MNLFANLFAAVNAENLVTFFAGALTAIFADPLRQRIFRPKPKFLFGSTNDFDLRGPLELARPTGAITVQGTIIRGAVTNHGMTTANGCRVYLINIEKQNDRTKTFDPTDYGDTIPLQWSSKLKQTYDINVQRETIQYFDILDIREGDASFHPHLEFSPGRYTPLLNQKGVFRFTFQLAGDGFSPIKMKLIFTWNGKYPEYSAQTES